MDLCPSESCHQLNKEILRSWLGGVPWQEEPSRVEAFVHSVNGLSRCVEDLGALLYPPHDAAELSGVLDKLSSHAEELATYSELPQVSAAGWPVPGCLARGCVSLHMLLFADANAAFVHNRRGSKMQGEGWRSSSVTCGTPP